MALEDLMAERASCYHLARQINGKRVILARALRVHGDAAGAFAEVLLHDLNELTLQLRDVLSRSRRLTLQIIFQQEAGGPLGS